MTVEKEIRIKLTPEMQALKKELDDRNKQIKALGKEIEATQKKLDALGKEYDKKSSSSKMTQEETNAYAKLAGRINEAIAKKKAEVEALKQAQIATIESINIEKAKTIELKAEKKALAAVEKEQSKQKIADKKKETAAVITEDKKQIDSARKRNTEVSKPDAIMEGKTNKKGQIAFVPAAPAAKDTVYKSFAKEIKAEQVALLDNYLAMEKGSSSMANYRAGTEKLIGTINKLRQEAKETGKDTELSNAQLASLLKSIKGLDSLMNQVAKGSLQDLGAANKNNEITAKQWRAELDKLEGAFTATNSLQKIWLAESVKANSAIDAEIKLDERKLALKKKLAAENLTSFNKQLREIQQEIPLTGIDAAVARLNDMKGRARELEGGLEKLYLAIYKIDTRLRTESLNQLRLKLEGLNIAFKNTGSVEHYRRLLFALREDAEKMGLGEQGFNMIDKAIIKLDETLARSVPTINQFKEAMNKLQAAYYGKEITQKQLIEGYEKMRSEMKLTTEQTKILNKAIFDAEKKIGTMAHSMGFLGQTAKTAWHHFQWMLSGALIMPFYNLPSQILTTVTELDKSFAKLRSVFQLEPKYAGDLQKINDIMKDLSGWSYKFSRYYGEDITKVNNVMFTAAQRYKNTADIIIVSNAAMKLSLLDFNDNVETSMTNLMAVMAQFDIGPKFAEDVVNKVIIAGNAVSATAGDIIEGLKRSASVIRQVGGDLDLAISIIAVSLDRSGESAETMGNTWKTLAQRMSSGRVGAFLKEKKIELFETAGQARDFNVVLQEMLVMYSKLSDRQRNEFTTMVAGVRQGNRLVNLLRKDWKELYETISKASPEELQKMVSPAVATQIESVARRMKSLSQVWAAFVFHIMGSESARVVAAKLFNLIINSIDFMEKHWDSIIKWAKYLTAVGAAYLYVNTCIRLANGAMLISAALTATLGSVRGFLGMGAAATTAAGGVKALSGAVAGLSAAMSANLVVLGSAVTLMAQMVAMKGAMNLMGGNKIKAEIKDKWTTKNESVENIQAEINLRKQRRDIIKDETKSEKERAIQAKALKDQASFGYSDAGLKKLLKEEKDKRGHLRAAYTEAQKMTETNPVKILKDIGKGVQESLFSPKGWRMDMDAMLADAKKLASIGTTDIKNPNADDPGYGPTGKDKKGKKGNVYTFEEQYKDKLQLIQDYLDKLEKANSKTMQLFERNTEEARKSLVGFFGEMVNSEDVKAYHDTLNSVYIRLQNSVRTERILIDDYSEALKTLQKNKDEVDKKLATTSPDKELRGKLEQSSRDYQKAIDDVLEKQDKARDEIYKMQETAKDMIKESAEATVKGLGDTYKSLTEANDKLLDDGKITPHQWQQNWHKATQALVADFEPLQQIMKEGYAANPRAYITAQDALIKELQKADVTKAENAKALEDAVTKKLAAEMFMENVTLKQISLEKSLANDVYPRQYETLKRKHELQKAQINLSGRESLTIAEQEKQAKESLALLGKRMILAISLNNKEEAHALLMEAFGIKQSIYDAKKAEAAAVLNHHYDRQLKSLEEQYSWKTTMARDDQKDDLALINNMMKKEILLNKQAELYSKLNFSLTDNQRIVDEEWQAYESLTDEIEALNIELASQVPILKEIQEASNTAFNSMKENIKSTFTDLFDSTKNLGETITGMFQRQGEIMKTTIINALTEAFTMKYKGAIGGFADSQGAITAGIFNLLGLKAPEEQEKAEKIWNSVYDKSAGALRVTFASKDTAGGGIMSSLINSTISSALGTSGAGGSSGGILAGLLGISGGKSGKISGAAGGGGVHGGKTAAALGIISQLIASGDSSGGWASSLGGMLGQAAGEATGGVFGSIFGGLGTLGGPVGTLIGTLLGTAGSNALGVGRGQQRRDVMQGQQEQRAATTADIKSRYESLGMAVSDTQLGIPEYIERSERSKGGLSGTSRWYEDNGVAQALDLANRKIAQIEESIKIYETAVKDMNNALAMGATRFNIAGQAIGQTIGGWQTKTDAMRAGGSYREWTIGTAESIFGPGGTLGQNIADTNASFNSLTSQIDLLKYQLNQMAIAGAEESDAFKEAAQNLLELTQTKYWNDIRRGISESELLKPFGLTTDQTTADATAKAIRAAFGLAEGTIIDKAQLQTLAQAIVQAEIMAQNGELTGTAAEQVNQQWELITEMISLIDTISTSQLGEAAVGSAANLGEAISGSAQVVQNDITFAVSAENFFATQSEMQNIAREMLLMMKKQNWVNPAVINI